MLGSMSSGDSCGGNLGTGPTRLRWRGGWVLLAAAAVGVAARLAGVWPSPYWLLILAPVLLIGMLSLLQARTKT